MRDKNLPQKNSQNKITVAKLFKNNRTKQEYFKAFEKLCNS